MSVASSVGNHVELTISVRDLRVTISGPLPSAAQLAEDLAQLDLGEPASAAADSQLGSSSWTLPSEPPALSSSLVGETREQILASFPACPDSCLHSARRLVGLVSDTEFRIRRAWLAGQWARAVLDVEFDPGSTWFCGPLHHLPPGASHLPNPTGGASGPFKIPSPSHTVSLPRRKPECIAQQPGWYFPKSSHDGGGSRVGLFGLRVGANYKPVIADLCSGVGVWRRFGWKKRVCGGCRYEEARWTSTGSSSFLFDRRRAFRGRFRGPCFGSFSGFDCFRRCHGGRSRVPNRCRCRGFGGGCRPRFADL